MQPRDLPAEVAHLRDWWATNKADKPPLARLATRAGLNYATSARFFNDATLRVSTSWLDRFYPVLAAAGYEPLSSEYLFL